MVVVRRMSAEGPVRPDFMTLLVELVNRAYAEAESGLWLKGAQRTNMSEIRQWIEAGEMVLALDGQAVVGAVRSRHRDDGSSWFGALAVDPAVSGQGVGRTLVEHIEREAVALGCQTMELEVLTVAVGHVHLDRLRQWYARLGYAETSRRDLKEVSPEEAPFMAVEIEAVVMHKQLAAGSA